MKLKDADCLGCDELSELPVETLRGIFRTYRKTMGYVTTRADIADALACADPKTPAEWVIAMRGMTTNCDRCRGTGTYSWGACVNGRMEHSGTCFRCQGKGYLTMSDSRRCYGYDNYAISTACR